MEDALVHMKKLVLAILLAGLNPCFNGRCTRTPVYIGSVYGDISCLNPCFNGRCTRTYLI